MKNILLVGFKLTVILSIVFVCGVMVVETNNLSAQVASTNTKLDRLYFRVVAMNKAYDEAYEAALIESFAFAPKGKTIYQLRGDAQEQAQKLLDKITEKHGLPQYQLDAIKFRPALRHVYKLTGEVSYNAAGQATSCEDANGHYDIYLNELLYLRNYNEFLYMIIPHEVSHIATCMLGGFPIDEDEDPDLAAHGEEWESAMRDLGFIKPGDFATHDLDVSPIYNYRLDLAFRLDTELTKGIEIE